MILSIKESRSAAYACMRNASFTHAMPESTTPFRAVCGNSVPIHLSGIVASRGGYVFSTTSREQGLGRHQWIAADKGVAHGCGLGDTGRRPSASSLTLSHRVTRPCGPSGGSLVGSECSVSLVCRARTDVSAPTMLASKESRLVGATRRHTSRDLLILP